MSLWTRACIDKVPAYTSMLHLMDLPVITSHNPYAAPPGVRTLRIEFWRFRWASIV